MRQNQQRRGRPGAKETRAGPRGTRVTGDEFELRIRRGVPTWGGVPSRLPGEPSGAAVRAFD